MADITREEQYLRALSGEDVNLPDPVTRREYFLAKAAGMDVVTPEPVTREEAYLSQIQGGDSSPFELYLTSDKYRASYSLTNEEKTELWNTNRTNSVIAYFESEGVVYKALRYTCTSNIATFGFYGESVASSDYLKVTFAQGTSKINKLEAKINSVTKSVNQVWFEYYKLKT